MEKSEFYVWAKVKNFCNKTKLKTKKKRIEVTGKERIVIKKVMTTRKSKSKNYEEKKKKVKKIHSKKSYN